MDSDCRLQEENSKILREHAEVIERARRREDAEAAKHEATCSFQKSDYRYAAHPWSQEKCRAADAMMNDSAESMMYGLADAS